MNVEPIIFLGGQGQHCLPEGTLDGTQLFPTRLLFLGATLRVNDLDQLCFERLQPLAQGNIGGIIDDPCACAGRETDERRIEMPLQIPQIPRRARKMIKQGEIVDDARSAAVKRYAVAIRRLVQVELDIDISERCVQQRQLM